MGRTLYVAVALVVGFQSMAEAKIDLSQIGNKSKETKKVVENPDYYEEEVISTQVYQSSGDDVGARRSVEFIKPTQGEIKLTTAEQPAQESLFAPVDEFLGIEPVKPWQKGTLAKKEMKPGGIVAEFDVFSEKVFAYKQGSVGGSGVGGGGCGCN